MLHFPPFFSPTMWYFPPLCDIFPLFSTLYYSYLPLSHLFMAWFTSLMFFFAIVEFILRVFFPPLFLYSVFSLLSSFFFPPLFLFSLFFFCRCTLQPILHPWQRSLFSPRGLFRKGHIFIFFRILVMWVLSPKRYHERIYKHFNKEKKYLLSQQHQILTDRTTIIINNKEIYPTYKIVQESRQTYLLNEGNNNQDKIKKDQNDRKEDQNKMPKR